jgi:hypothetical protein
MNTTKDFLTEKITQELAKRHCFFDEEGEQQYDVSHADSGPSMRLMFKWEFDRATNPSSRILDFSNWSFKDDELVFSLGDDWNTSKKFYLAAYWVDNPGAATGGYINWHVSDCP